MLYFFILYTILVFDRFQLGEDVNFEEVVAGCPLTLTGADFYALCSDAFLCAMKDRIADLFEADGDPATKRKGEISVDFNHSR